MSVLPEQEGWTKRPVRSEKSWPVMGAQCANSSCERCDWREGGVWSLAAGSAMVLAGVGEGRGGVDGAEVERRLARC